MVSPGRRAKVTDVSAHGGRRRRLRISIFLNVFNVHVNRSPIARRSARRALPARQVSERHERGFRRRERAECGHGRRRRPHVIFKQIAGLLARRIVFNPKVGDRLERGQRVGLIKFGSRVDVVLDALLASSEESAIRSKAEPACWHTSPTPRTLTAAGTASAAERAH